MTQYSDPDKPIQRRRKNWTPEEDDTLLDAEAIIRARSRDTNAKGRAAMVQIFPEVGPQTYLFRVKKLLGMPGKQAYFGRLEDAWYDVWIEHRGTEALPDPDPSSASNFDLPAHLRFLREKVPKLSM